MLRELCLFPRDFKLEDILDVKGRLGQLFHKEGVQVAYLYGSLAEIAKGGDADIAVLFESYSPSAYQNLHHELCLALGADNIDLLPLNRASFPLQKRVILTGLLLYEQTGEVNTRLAEEVLAGLDDYRYLSRLLEAELRKRVEGGLSIAARQLDEERIRSYLSRLDEVVERLASLKSQFAFRGDFRSKVVQREALRALPEDRPGVCPRCLLSLPGDQGGQSC